MKRVYHAVIFDLDGVLADTVEYHYLATKQVSDKLNIPFDRELNQRMQGMSRTVLIEELVRKSDRSYTPLQKAELGNQKNANYQQLISRITKDDILPGMSDFITTLKKNHMKMAIASASSNAKTVLDNLEISHYFDHIVDIHDVKKMKPDPEIFLKAADALNVPYDKCIAIEDSEAGIKAIKQTPMFSIGVGEHAAVKSADWHVHSTEEISYEKLLTLVSLSPINA
ncbi:beta-phosphoglucomutase [Alkalihalobacterium elongatum]|uniref:beta-phosphoglucomutase n=1 Tax=Alkalihalobacterium elongatum TaxID=2675466 RepID=UPI001C1FCD36|nr:beta-phosphoglucomutase [Alkalihalobacterium elongatum]